MLWEGLSDQDKNVKSAGVSEIFPVECCEKLSQSIREVTRRVAKNTEWLLGFSLCECAGQPYFAAAERVQPNVNEPSCVRWAWIRNEGMDCQVFCSGLLMVIGVYVGHNWALPRLAGLRWHILGTCQDGGWGRSTAAAGRQLHIALTLAATRTGPGALRGRSPRTREAACGRPPKCEERVKRSEE